MIMGAKHFVMQSNNYTRQIQRAGLDLAHNLVKPMEDLLGYKSGRDLCCPAGRPATENTECIACMLGPPNVSTR
jgi:hypothetical protein